MNAEELKKIEYPQITQITQISSEASDTVKDRTARRRTLEPVQDTGRSYQHRTAAKLGHNDLGEWISSVVPDFLTPECDSPESEICVICVICGYLICAHLRIHPWFAFGPPVNFIRVHSRSLSRASVFSLHPRSGGRSLLRCRRDAKRGPVDGRPGKPADCSSALMHWTVERQPDQRPPPDALNILRPLGSTRPAHQHASPKLRHVATRLLRIFRRSGNSVYQPMRRRKANCA
jgi:hypothetical protein